MKFMREWPKFGIKKKDEQLFLIYPLPINIHYAINYLNDI